MTSDDRKAPEEMICFCYGVLKREILEEIQKGARSIEEIRARTQANTGCGGCLEEVLALLKEYSVQGPSRK